MFKDINELSAYLTAVSEFVKNKSTVEDFAAYVLVSYDLKSNQKNKEESSDDVIEKITKLSRGLETPIEQYRSALKSATNDFISKIPEGKERDVELLQGHLDSIKKSKENFEFGHGSFRKTKEHYTESQNDLANDIATESNANPTV